MMLSGGVSVPAVRPEAQLSKQATAATSGDDNTDLSPEQRRRTTSVYLPVTMLEELDEIGREEHLSRTWLIEAAVRDWLKERRKK